MISDSLPVLVIVARRASRGREADLHEWADDLCWHASTFPGYLTSGVRRRPHRDTIEVVTDLGSASARELMDWEESEERRGYLDQVEPLVQGDAVSLTLEGLEGVGRTLLAGERRPPRWRTALFVWIALYPPALLSAYFLAPQLRALPLPVQLLISSPITVAVVIWVTLPFVHRLATMRRSRRGRSQ